MKNSMNNPSFAVLARSARAITFACAGMFALSALITACADKGLTRPGIAFNPKISLLVTITADQRAGFGPRFLLAAAGFDGEKDNNGDSDGGFLGYKVIPFAPGTQTLTVPIDLSPCLAYWAGRGRQFCPLLIGAAIVEDTSFVSDTSGGDGFSRSFDYYFAGPFNIGTGGVLPTIPPIDLSASRFAVVKWEGDNALRLGGNETPVGFSGPITGFPGAGSAAPTIFATTQGNVNTSTGNQGFSTTYPFVSVLQNGTWKRFPATLLPGNQGPQSLFTDIAAVAANEAYMAHRTGLYKFDGSAMTKVAAITDSVVSVASVVTATGTKLVIAGGSNGVVWIGNTQTWTRYVLPSAPILSGGVCITGPNEAFAASGNGTASGALYRFDGTNWTSVPAAANTGNKVNLQCPAPGQAFVHTQGAVRFSWNGSTWVQMSSVGLGGGRSFSWAVVSPTEIYAAADSANVDRTFYKFNGTSWQEIGRARVTQPVVEGWADPRGGAYFGSSAFGRVERVTATAVSVVSYAPSMRDVVMSSLTSAFVVGHYSLLARWDGAKWTVDAPPPGVNASRTLRGVWSDGPTNAWAVGNASAAFRFNGTGWSTVATGVTDNHQAVWGVGTDVWIAGDASMVHCKGASGCQNEPTGGSGSLKSVWGTSATNVFAVGAGGRITRFNGTSWSAMTSPTGRTLLRVAGSGPSDVWAVGDSVLLHFNGTQWTPFVDPDGELNRLIAGRGLSQGNPLDNVGMFARGPKEMYFTGGNGNVGRYDGIRVQGMGLEGFRHTMVGLSGLTAGCAIGVTEAFSDTPVPTMWRGIGPTGCLLAPMVPPLTWP